MILDFTKRKQTETLQNAITFAFKLNVGCKTLLAKAFTFYHKLYQSYAKVILFNSKFKFEQKVNTSKKSQCNMNTNIFDRINRIYLKYLLKRNKMTLLRKKVKNEFYQ